MQPTTENFSNINVRPSQPGVGGGGDGSSGPRATLNVATGERIQFNRNCLVLATIRALLIIFQFAGWVSAAAIPKPYYGSNYLPVDFNSTRSAYLFFSITGFFIAIVFFIFMILNIANWKVFARLPWILMLLITDAIWILPTLILSIVCAVHESTVDNSDNTPWGAWGGWSYTAVINQGAFGSAAAFGFMCTLLYIIGVLLEALGLMRNGLDAKIPSA